MYNNSGEELLKTSILKIENNQSDSDKPQNYNFNKIEYQKYRIKNIDTIESIVKIFGLDIDTIILVNNIKKKSQISVGVFLLIPNQNGRIITIAKNDSIYKISNIYGISWKLIADVNNVPSSILEEGTKLFIPGSKMTNYEREQYENNQKFEWPLNRKITSYFGQRIDPFTRAFSYHTGIDIKQDYGCPVKSVNNRYVILVNFDNIFGNYIIIKHSNGLISKYCHLSKIYVKKGDYVQSRQNIAAVGSTGRSTDAHLHLEIRRNGKLLDPLKYLN